MNNKLMSMFGLARRAGKLSFGFDAVLADIKARKAVAVFIASDISEKSAENIEFHATKNNIEVRKISETMSEISYAIGKRAGIVSLTDRNFGTKALTLCQVMREENVI